MMRRNSDDDDEDSFGGVFDQIDGMLSGMTDEKTAPVDIHEYDDEIRVVADLPDATLDDIDIQCDGRSLAIRVAGEPRPFVTRVDLPAYVDEGSVQTSFNNGVLEITLDRDTDPANIGFH
jgi:HSP20 family protein